MIPKSAEAVQALIMRAGIVVNVTRGDRLRLEAIVADRCAPQKHVWRANVILATDEEGPRWDDDPRLQTPWHNDVVRRPQCARWYRHRPQHAAPPAPGVHPLPQHR